MFEFKKKELALVVDDDEAVRAVVAALLGLTDFEVMQAENAEVALEFIKSGKRFALVVSDVEMPGMTGWELYVCALQINTDLQDRFLFMTGRPDSEAVQPIIEAKKPLLAKPFIVAELRAAVGQVRRFAQV